jgi:putative peptidoglycan binding protein
MHSLRTIAFATLLILPVGLTVAETATTTKKKSTATTKKRKTSTKKRTGTTTASSKSSPAARQTWRTRQLQPSPERYKEIQGALVSKGYLSGEPSGAWSHESVEALRRFQQDQNLEATGKIDSLSLIALGLGPKRQTVAAATPPAAN